MKYSFNKNINIAIPDIWLITVKFIWHQQCDKLLITKEKIITKARSQMTEISHNNQKKIRQQSLLYPKSVNVLFRPNL